MLKNWRQRACAARRSRVTDALLLVPQDCNYPRRGCTDILATNYVRSANVDDGSCRREVRHNHRFAFTTPLITAYFRTCAPHSEEHPFDTTHRREDASTLTPPILILVRRSTPPERVFSMSRVALTRSPQITSRMSTCSPHL